MAGLSAVRNDRSLNVANDVARLGRTPEAEVILWFQMNFDSIQTGYKNVPGSWQ